MNYYTVLKPRKKPIINVKSCLYWKLYWFWNKSSVGHSVLWITEKSIEEEVFTAQCHINLIKNFD